MKSFLLGAFAVLFGVSLFVGMDTSFASPLGDAASGLKASVEDPFGVTSTKIDAASDNTDLQSSLISIINQMLLFLGLLLLFIVIYAGFLIITSDGKEDAITKGRKMIIYALIGVIVIVLSYTIVNWIGTIGTNLTPAATSR